jgi:hypothetical protein
MGNFFSKFCIKNQKEKKKNHHIGMSISAIRMVFWVAFKFLEVLGGGILKLWVVKSPCLSALV